MNEEVMDEILKAAKEEFLTLGYTEASMRNIAKKANLTTGSLYYRFLDKAEMLDAVVGNEAEFCQKGNRKPSIGNGLIYREWTSCHDRLYL